MLQILLKGKTETGFLDLFPGTRLELESLTPVFDEDLSTGEFSLPIDFPWTENNRRLTSFIERLTNSTNVINYWEIDVLDDGLPELQNAKLTLLEKSGNINYSSGKFTASISGTKGLFGSTIKNKKLRELTLGGPIVFNSTCRDFATDHAKGNYPQFPQIGFAPVVIENFFDTTKSYTDEFLVKDTVNNIVITGSGLNDWLFGRPQSSIPDNPAGPTDPEYINYRTVPFFKFKFIIKKVFEELGYTLTGEMLDTAAWEDLFVFNTTGIEFYSNTVFLDYTRRIEPGDHVPDILIADFLRSAFLFFNIYPVFTAQNVELRYRKRIFSERKVLNISEKCGAIFSGHYADETDKTGYSVDYEWDPADDYRNDRVKEIKPDAIVATVNTEANLATLNIGRPFTTDDIAFVESENMYYKVANATTSPVLWDAWSERLGEFTKDKGGDSLKIGLGTLCNYVEFDETDALFVRRDKLATRQNGSYWTNKYIRVKKDFSLRLFYIRKQLINGNEIPTSMNNDRTAAGTLLNPCSLSLEGPTGLLASFHNAWLRAKQNKETISIPLPADKKLMTDLKACNTIQINNVLFLHVKTDSSLPLGATVDIELKPL